MERPSMESVVYHRLNVQVRPRYILRCMMRYEQEGGGGGERRRMDSDGHQPKGKRPFIDFLVQYLLYGT